jgi:hypothetical protein
MHLPTKCKQILTQRKKKRRYRISKVESEKTRKVACLEMGFLGNVSGFVPPNLMWGKPKSENFFPPPTNYDPRNAWFQ